MAKNLKVEIPSFETKRKKTAKKSVKKSPVTKVVKKTVRKKTPELKDKEVLEISGKNLLIRIPNELFYVSKAKRILEVYEADLEDTHRREQKVHIPEDDEDDTEDFDEETEETPVPSPELSTQPQELREQKVVEVKKPEGESYDMCPLCNSKLKKKKIKKEGDLLIQKVKCKNKKCFFAREYRFSI